MKIATKINCFLLGATLLITAGCSDSFLSQTDTSNINENILFLKPADGYSLVTGVYNTLNSNIDYPLKGIWFTANFPSQDFHNWGSDTFWNTYEIPTAFDALNTFWVTNYIGIARANSAIPILTKMKANGVLSETEANQLIGECYFLRGLFYYYLAVDFGGVPLELETVTDQGLHPRNTQDEVFLSIASDMQKASELIKWKSDQALTDRGRATKDAALAFQGDALMWLKKYSEAIPIFEQLDSRFSLEENYVNVHELSHKNGKESIFELQFRNYGAMNWGAFGVNNQWISSFGMPVPISGFGYSYGDKKLYDSYQSNDTRKLATIIGPDDKHPSPLINLKDYPQLIKFAKSGNGNIPATYYQDATGAPINTCGTAAHPWVEDSRSGYYGVKFWRNPETCGTKGTSWFLSPDN
ncbi:MAG TPA: hypothetical protein DCW42_04105, partial [Bacteroidetes bacterium]|nr:hypothetical protein [Bacteroidota bacterium]